MTDLWPDHVVVHPVPCELDTLERYLSACALRGTEPGEWPGSPCLIEGTGRDRMCLTCGGVDPRDYDPQFHGPDQSLLARRGRVAVQLTRIEAEERPRTETDCTCRIGGSDECPCEADGTDGLCKCCRDDEHRGLCAAP